MPEAGCRPYSKFCIASRRPRAFNDQVRIALLLTALATLAVLPYVPVFSQPLIADDYQQIDISRTWGPPSGWASLASDRLYRSRATSILYTWWTDSLLGVAPSVLYASTLLLHVLNVWLLFALGSWKRIGWRISFTTAAFFAVYLGHQEAVMWYAALHELIMFFFVICFLLVWTRWMARPSGGWSLYLASFALFLLAIFSKEPGVVLVPFAALIAWWDGSRRRVQLAGVIPFAAIAVIYTYEILTAGKTYQHLNDGTFSIHAPFWITWRNSFGRLLWVWGLLSLIWLAMSGEWRRYRTLLLAAGVWISIALLPFSFLTYMPRIPSRHTYLPSAGLALLVGVAFVSFRDRMQTRSRFAAPAVAAVLIAHHCVYLWFVKRPQYLARAAASETVLRLVREGHTPVSIECFPYASLVGNLAVSIVLHREPGQLLIWKDGYQRADCPSGVFTTPDSATVTQPAHAALR